MRMYKVYTRVDLTIKTNWFGKKKYEHCYFTYKTKYIYAKNKMDAHRKYSNYFFTPLEHKYNKTLLSFMRHISETESDNMMYNLSFNQSIDENNEKIVVNESEIIENVDVVRRNSMAGDFIDWFNHLKCYEESYDPDWDDK